MRILTFFTTLLSFCLSFSQESTFSASTIDEALVKGANAVVRNHKMHIRLLSITDMEMDYERTVTVLNENGNKHTNLFVGYDKSINVKNAQAEIYDGYGNLIKKLKKRDFLDVSAVDGGTLYSDSRILYSGYLPVQYPYTVKFTYQIKTDNTGNLPSWSFVDDFLVSTEKSRYTFEYLDPALKPVILEKNFKGFPITSTASPNKITYEAKKIEVHKNESLMPSKDKVFPSLMVSPVNFYYEGYKGSIKNWSDVGHWMNNNLLKGQGNLNSSTISQVKELVAGMEDNLDIAKKVYQYVQQNTRYISVQVGIGGLKPISAIEVDRVKYGDCKGLANYTKALLKAVGVEAYYVHVEAGPNKVDFEPNMASLAQGNHVILAIPYNEKYHWIDCTSQVHPFGFLGDFTDDRDVLVIKDSGGEIAHTAVYSDEDNHQITKGNYQLDNLGNLTGNVEITTKGIQYDQHFGLERGTKLEVEKYYKGYWSNVDNLTVEEYKFNNDKDSIVFKEIVSVKSASYASKSDNRLVFVANAFNNPQSVPRRYRNRKFPMEISRGYLDEDEFEILIPEDYSIESLPQPAKLETKFGNYHISFDTDGDRVRVKRKILIKKGTYPSTDYSSYRSFKRSISKLDNSKIVIIKKG